MERLGSTIIATTIISIISYQIFQLFHRVILLHEIAEFKKEKKKDNFTANVTANDLSIINADI